MNVQARREFFNVPQGEAGYSWLYRTTALNGGFRALVTILVIGLAAAFFAWYTHTSADAAPDSALGLIYAVIGTLLILLAIIMYSLRKRSSHRQRELGGLRASLGWHMCFAIMGLAFVGMHSFGEFNPRTGTYALYGMIALVISGLIGRMLDRLMPRLIAGEAHQAMTAQGDDRIETISEKLQAIVVHNTQDIRGFVPPQNRGNSLVPSSHGRAMTWRDQTLHTPWDLGYISLEETPQEMSQTTDQFRALSGNRLLRPGALMPGTQEQMIELDEVRRAMQRELLYRYIIRYWRRFHVLLSLVTVGLVIWHIVYALQLMLPTIFH